MMEPRFSMAFRGTASLEVNVYSIPASEAGGGGLFEVQLYSPGRGDLRLVFNTPGEALVWLRQVVAQVRDAYERAMIAREAARGYDG